MSARRISRKKNMFILGVLFLVVAVFAIADFFMKNIAIVIGIIVVIIGAVVGIVMFKKREVLPKIDVSEDISQKIMDLIQFVYAGGSPPSPPMPSKKYQHNILCQLYSWEEDLNQYESYAQQVYENIMGKTNTYQNITDREDYYDNLHFAFEGLVKSIIDVTKEPQKTHSHFSAMDNLSGRLLQINHDKFKELFFKSSEYHFWYVYNKDAEYPVCLKKIKYLLKGNEGIKQTLFYQLCPDSKETVSRTLYFAEKAGEIIRKKEGRSYRLYLPEQVKGEP